MHADMLAAAGPTARFSLRACAEGSRAMGVAAEKPVMTDEALNLQSAALELPVVRLWAEVPATAATA
jgi:hypothetical protein